MKLWNVIDWFISIHHCFVNYHWLFVYCSNAFISGEKSILKKDHLYLFSSCTIAFFIFFGWKDICKSFQYSISHFVCQRGIESLEKYLYPWSHYKGVHNLFVVSSKYDLLSAPTFFEKKPSFSLLSETLHFFEI